MRAEILFVAALVLASIAFLYLGVRLGTRIGRLRAEKGFASRLESGRLDAVKRSRAVLGGQLSEQVAPFLPGFPGDPGEARFIGKPVDFVLFSGLSRGTVDEVVFVEVKSGGSRLSPSELALRKAVADGRVRFVEYRVPAEPPAGAEPHAAPGRESPDVLPDGDYAFAPRPGREGSRQG